MGIKPSITTLTNTTAGTRTQVISNDTYVVSVYFEALRTNTGVIYVGDNTVSSTKYASALPAGAGWGISTDAQGKIGGELQLSDLYVDSSVSGEKVQMTYLRRVGSD